MAAAVSLPESFDETVDIINAIDSVKFSLFFNQTIKRLSSDATNKKIFSEEEKEKLTASLALKPADLDLVLKGITFLIDKAAYNVTKPALFQQQLSSLGLQKEKVEAMVQGWISSAKGIVDQLRQASMAPKQLEEVNWSLNLQLGSSRQTKQKIPLCLLQFGLKKDDERENLTVEMDHADLFKFYSQLEEIQAQLDSLR